MLLHLGLAAVLATPLPWTAPADPIAPIYGGELVEPGAWPDAVAIVLPGALCTGTLVSPRVVLTAAHCLDTAPSVELLRVRLGDDINIPGVPSYEVVSYGTHPEFCGTDTEVCKQDIWDYGYLVLDRDVADVTPARPLTQQEQWDEAMAVGNPITVVGYGLDEKMLTGIKRQVEVPIVRFSPTGLEFQAGGEGMDSCQGDSGGPAYVTLSTGEVVLAGVTSRGYTCGKGGFYAIPYAALCWLNQETGVDLRTDACDACDCLDTNPADDERCGCAADDPGGPLGLLVLLLLARPRRLSRPGSRRSRTSPC